MSASYCSYRLDIKALKCLQKLGISMNSEADEEATYVIMDMGFGHYCVDIAIILFPRSHICLCYTLVTSLVMWPRIVHVASIH